MYEESKSSYGKLEMFSAPKMNYDVRGIRGGEPTKKSCYQENLVAIPNSNYCTANRRGLDMERLNFIHRQVVRLTAKKAVVLSSLISFE